MQECKNCHKSYTLRGLGLHLKKCDIVYKELREIKKAQMKELELLKTDKLVITIVNNTQFIDTIPPDCIKEIYKYLFMREKKDKYISYFDYYTDILNMSLVCKQFYLAKPVLTDEDKEKLEKENEETICKTWCKNIYHLTDEDISDLKFERRYNNYARYEVHLYNLKDIINIAFEKYGYEFQYLAYKKKMDDYKLLDKKEKKIIDAQRKNDYDQLFNKYTDQTDIYHKYLKSYTKKEMPRLINIEKEIKKNLLKIDKRDKLIESVKKDNLNYFETNVVIDYLDGRVSFEDSYHSIANKNSRADVLKEELTVLNINFDDYSNLSQEYLSCMDDNNVTICKKELLEKINKIEFFRKYMNCNDKILPILDLYDSDIMKKITMTVEPFLHNWCIDNKDTVLTKLEFYDKIPISILEIIKYKINNIKRREIVLIQNNIKHGLNVLNPNYKCSHTPSSSCMMNSCRHCCTMKECHNHKKKKLI